MTMKTKALRSFEISGTTHPVIQRHIPEELTLYQYRCKNIKSRNIPIFEIGGSRSGVAGTSGILECDAVVFGVSSCTA
jgi:hypothetical protein